MVGKTALDEIAHVGDEPASFDYAAAVGLVFAADAAAEPEHAAAVAE